MNKITLMVGIQGSGKSHFAEIVEDKNNIVLSCDRIRAEYPTLNEAAVWRIFYEQLSAAVKNKKDIIIDNTNIKRKWRKEIIDRYKDNRDYYFRAIICQCPLNICIERNHQRDRVVPQYIIEKYNTEFEMPTYDEGFNSIWYVNTVTEQLYINTMVDED